MSNLTLLLTIIISMLFSVASFSKKVTIDVLVEDGYYPIIIDAENRQGFAFEFINILNTSQQTYHFNLHALPSKRLIKIVEEKDFDALFFMAIEWLPKPSQLSLLKTATSVAVKNEFYALKEEGRDQHFFDNFDSLTKGGVYGYSYRFADYNTNANFLNNVHQMSLTKSGIHVAQMLLLKRVDVGILSNISYQYFKKTRRFNMDKFYKSTTPDGVYDTSLLISQHSPNITVEQFNQIIMRSTIKLKINGVFNKYGIEANLTEH